ncbi:hypothetical protein A1Q2_03865 [Trichosporon asahii var. asahii CBS 8904]|uniref:Ubiquitin carboxyl-terminal hydrolase n=1 Tax=Trichosporon asahii var. asahii (strain CBS 8904) TaxID=1220162 RepID=K1VQU8_TRIAC|nr:hypothetical protein A1Q2_03865 [Trichosporon asahii var. asahii CBS 8904]
MSSSNPVAKAPCSKELERDWWPLESSPDVLTKLARHWDLPNEYEFVDVLGLDPELLSLVSRPVHAVVFLFPDTPTIVDHRTKEGPGTPAARGQEPLWIPQVGVALDPDRRTALLAASPLIKPAHMAVVAAGDSQVRESDWEDADHFLAFVRHDGRIWEMDGNTPRAGPLDRGPASNDLLEDAARIIRDVYIPRAEGSVHFSTIALVGPESGAGASGDV